MKFFGVEVSLTEIEQIYDDINRFFNKEAEQRCMGLKIANENIEQWYNEVVAYLKDFVEGNVSYGQFFNFTHKRERVPVSERSTFFLGSSWFNNYKPGILKRPIDLHELSEPIRENIYNYKEKAVGRKVQWLEEAKEEDIMNVPREKVNQWVKDLDR